MNLKSLEKDLFKTKSKSSLIKEAIAGCTAIVEDTFLGNNINGLKDDFPKGIKFKDIKIALQAVQLNIEHSTASTPSLQISVSMEDTDRTPLGNYMIMYDDSLNRIDEFFIIE